jgi:hypothetical protein
VGSQTSYNANHNSYNGTPYNEKHNQLDEDAFAAKGSIVSAFDAFREYTFAPLIGTCPVKPPADPSPRP